MQLNYHLHNHLFLQKSGRPRLSFNKAVFLFSIIILFCSCETHRFDSDKRQITAKDIMMERLHYPNGFDVTGFHEDTVHIPGDSLFASRIQYSLDMEYLDSNKELQRKKGIVFFTPDGQSVISSSITDR